MNRFNGSQTPFVIPLLACTTLALCLVEAMVSESSYICTNSSSLSLECTFLYFSFSFDIFKALKHIFSKFSWTSLSNFSKLMTCSFCSTRLSLFLCKAFQVRSKRDILRVLSSLVSQRQAQKRLCKKWHQVNLTASEFKRMWWSYTTQKCFQLHIASQTLAQIRCLTNLIRRSRPFFWVTVHVRQWSRTQRNYLKLQLSKLWRKLFAIKWRQLERVS